MSFATPTPPLSHHDRLRAESLHGRIYAGAAAAFEHRVSTEVWLCEAAAFYLYGQARVLRRAIDDGNVSLVRSFLDDLIPLPPL